MSKDIIYLCLVLLLLSCKEDSKSQEQVISKDIENQNKNLRYFEDKDSLGNIMASYYLDDKELFNREIKIFYPNGVLKEFYNIHNDTIIGYVTENTESGELFAYKNYYNMLWDSKGNINEIIFYDTLGEQNKEKSLFVDIQKCFKDNAILDTGIIKVYPIDTDSVEILKITQNSDTLSIGWIKEIQKGEFNISLKNENIEKGDFLIFKLWHDELSKGVKDSFMYKIEKEINSQNYFVPTIWDDLNN